MSCVGLQDIGHRRGRLALESVPPGACLSVYRKASSRRRSGAPSSIPRQRSEQKRQKRKGKSSTNEPSHKHHDPRDGMEEGDGRGSAIRWQGRRLGGSLDRALARWSPEHLGHHLNHVLHPNHIHVFFFLFLDLRSRWNIQYFSNI